jgi:pyruvate dehydrogenase E2 component (dihydrolipoamide acetyltransferase)
MAALIRMPGISADAEEAALVEWFVTEGVEITAGSALAAVETEKATVDINAEDSGVIWKILVEPGTAVAIGAPIAIMIAAGEDTSDEPGILKALGLGGAAQPAAPVAEPVAAAVPAAAPAAVAPQVVEQPSEPASAADAGGPEWRRFASPLARKIARDNSIDLSSVNGSGPGGRIVRDDVVRLIGAAPVVSAPAPAPAAPVAVAPRIAGELVPHSKLRIAVANALSGSKRTSPHFYLSTTCRVDGLMALRQQVNESSAVRVSVNDFVIKAVAQAFVDVPEMNVQWQDAGLLTLGSIDISVAIASDKGLVTPVIRDADQARLTSVASQVKSYVELANTGRLKQTDLEGGSFTVTNLGMFGVDDFQAIINPPQVGILAVGAVSKQPVVEADGSLGVGQLMTVTLSADHRPVDGALAAKWLQALKRHLESPMGMLA